MHPVGQAAIPAECVAGDLWGEWECNLRRPGAARRERLFS